MATKKPFHLENLTTVVSVAILLGTELVAMAWAAGWALGGLFQLPPNIDYSIQAFLVALSLYGVYRFVRAALKVEPIRG